MRSPRSCLSTNPLPTDWQKEGAARFCVGDAFFRSSSQRGRDLAVLAAIAHKHHAANGDGSLRVAIQEANASGDVPHIITFAPEFPQFGVITLASNLPVITASDVRIRGQDRSPTIDGATFYAIFRAAINVSLELEDLKLQRGLNAQGGCVATATTGGSGSLLVTRGYFYQCMAIAATSPGGGAINWNAVSPALVTRVVT